MRAWKGKKRLAKKLNPSYFTEAWYAELLDYLLLCKPGDIIAACTGYNHRVTEIEVFWRTSKSGRTRIPVEVRVTDDEGRWHYFPGGGCVSMPETRQEIETYLLSWDCLEGHKTMDAWGWGDMRERIALIKKGVPVVTEEGLKIPMDLLKDSL